MLSEATILGAVVMALTGLGAGLWNGFSQKLGGNAAEKLVALAARSKGGPPKAHELAEAAHDLVPVLKAGGVNWDTVSAGIALELTKARQGGA